jgi:hypothetical protein
MGKTRNWMYSTVETIGQGTSGLSQTGTTQAAISKLFLNILIFLNLMKYFL